MPKIIIQSLAVLALAPAAIVTAYTVFLALYALSRRSRPARRACGASNTFAIIIPAYNEADTIASTLRSCVTMDYPKEKYNVYVIADNCTDSTAEAARAMGAQCLERHNPGERGKGFALAWAFERVLPAGYDAVVVLDADCTIDRHALTVFDWYLSRGYDILQASDETSNPDESLISYAAAGNLIENALFYAPKSALGLSVFLRGTGMVFKADVLRATPWSAYSVAEDVEYGITLLRKGHRIRFIEEARVSSDFPASKEQLKIQRMRWAGGNLRFGRANAVGLMIEGLVSGRPVLIDAGLTFLAQSRPLVLLNVLAALTLGAVSFVSYRDALSTAVFLGSAAVSALQILYFGLGAAMLGFSRQRMLHLLMAPAVVARLIAISLSGFCGAGSDVWAKTPRS